MEKISERIYNQAFPDVGFDVIKADVFPINDKDKLILTFVTKNSEWRQGVRLSCDIGVETNGQFNQSILLWYETAPKKVEVQCYTRNGLLVIYNIWDKGTGKNSLAYSSGMHIDEIDRGRLYRCNDIGFQTNFDKLVFKIEKI